MNFNRTTRLNHAFSGYELNLIFASKSKYYDYILNYIKLYLKTHRFRNGLFKLLCVTQYSNLFLLLNYKSISFYPV